MRLALLAWLALGATGAAAQDVGAGDLLIRGAWARPTPPGITVGAVYLSIDNHGTRDDTLLGVSSPLAARGEIHETATRSGVMSMRAVTALPLPHGTTVNVSPGGVHIMLLGIRQAWAPGTPVALTLTFQHAGSVTLSVPVEARD